jgi:hypothetical protein
MAGGPASTGSTGAGAPYMATMPPGSCGPCIGVAGGAGVGSVVATGAGGCGAGSWVEAQPSARVVAKVKAAARLRVVVDAGTTDAGAMAMAAAQKGQRAESLRTWREHDGHGASGELFMERDATAGGRRVSSEEAHRGRAERSHGGAAVPRGDTQRVLAGGEVSEGLVLQQQKPPRPFTNPLAGAQG